MGRVNLKKLDLGIFKLLNDWMEEINKESYLKLPKWIEKKKELEMESERRNENESISSGP